jgi:endoglucanase
VPGRASRRRRRPLLIILIAGGAAVLVAVVVVVAVALWRGTASNAEGPAPEPPAVGTTILAPPASHAAQALAEGTLAGEELAATEYLAAQPTAYWLTPEQDPIGVVGDTVRSLARDARTQDVSLAVVVYGLPGRDCGNHSAGGLSEEDYPVWVGAISDALASQPDLQRIVILEPDSLALAPECGNVDERSAQLRAAVEQLAAPNVWIYLDGGHSNWLPASEMAELILGVGAGDRIRGFATNVSNYQSSFDEFDYAHAVAGEAGGLHALIDTSRNGAASAGAEWCNPPDQRVGDAGGTYGDDVVDTNLWIKPPGESDGACNGGPAAGQWWPAGAVELTRDAR